MAVLRIATCQFPVSADIAANLRYIKRQLSLASQRGARVAHFPEGALSGYAGTDFATFAGFGWDQLQAATADVTRQASRLGIWLITGSAQHAWLPSGRPSGRSSGGTTRPRRTATRASPCRPP
jgi:predicted amidohydrolase